MMSSALMTATGTTGAGTLSAFITPSSVYFSKRSGTFTAPPLTVNVSGGVEPYVYAWTVASVGDAYITGADDEQVCRVRMEGFNETVTVNVQCFVTDDNMDTITANAIIEVEFT